MFLSYRTISSANDTLYLLQYLVLVLPHLVCFLHLVHHPFLFSLHFVILKIESLFDMTTKRSSRCLQITIPPCFYVCHRHITPVIIIFAVRIALVVTTLLPFLYRIHLSVISPPHTYRSRSLLIQHHLHPQCIIDCLSLRNILNPTI